MAVVPGWPPEEPVSRANCTKSAGRQPLLSERERAYWEARGLHIYEEV